MNRVTLTGEIVGHVGGTKTRAGIEMHQVTVRTVEFWAGGGGHEEFHTVLFFGELAIRARGMEGNRKVLLEAALRWGPSPCLHAHTLEEL